MNEQMWGIGGIVVGIVLTSAGNWWLEYSKFKRERARDYNSRAREICLRLLKSVDDEMASLDAYEDEHGVFPADMGHDPSESPARQMLTDVYVNTRPRFHSAAVALVDATDAWGWRGGPREEIQKRRTEFLDLVRTRL